VAGDIDLNLTVKVFSDGEEPPILAEVVAAWHQTWASTYASHAALEIGAPANLKASENRVGLPEGLIRIERIRNPDVFFVESSQGIELGGIEITSHSPDGSNIEKRYPFLWAAPGSRTNAFVATPYLKRRPGGQINRLPLRHIQRNQQFLRDWNPGQPGHSFLRQFIPLRELHMGDLTYVPENLKRLLVTWRELGSFFAHLLAARTLAGSIREHATAELRKWSDRLASLSQACVQNADHKAEASTLLKLPDRWIQVYNSRPDSGHWERGEGQFDSIDGRLMFTLDEISFLPESQRPRKMEFWLPQMVSAHPWIVEQRTRGHESKRLRNILVELASFCQTKFAEDLTEADWDILRDHPRLLLERKDWEPRTYSVADVIHGGSPRTIANAGISGAPRALREAIEKMLRDVSLYYCALRAYTPGCRSLLERQVDSLPAGATVLAPRLPAALVGKVGVKSRVNVVPAEMCSKEQLCMLRQLHRYTF
jgi:hypothetical protein